MTQKFARPIEFEGGIKSSDAASGSAIVPTADGVLVDDIAVLPRRVRLRLTNLSISVLAANDYGGSKILDLPDKNIMLLGMEADLTLVKGGVASGLISTVDLDVGIGTATASAQTLSGAMIDILEKVDLNEDSLTLTLKEHTAGQATASFPKDIVDGASSALYLNIGVPSGTIANDTVLVTGVIELYYLDLGNRTS